MQSSNNGCRYVLVPAAYPLPAIYCGIQTKRRRIRDDDGNIVVKWETFCEQHDREPATDCEGEE